MASLIWEGNILANDQVQIAGYFSDYSELFIDFSSNTYIIGRKAEILQEIFVDRSATWVKLSQKKYVLPLEGVDDFGYQKIAKTPSPYFSFKIQVVVNEDCYLKLFLS